MKAFFLRCKVTQGETTCTACYTTGDRMRGHMMREHKMEKGSNFKEHYEVLKKSDYPTLYEPNGRPLASMTAKVSITDA